MYLLIFSLKNKLLFFNKNYFLRKQNCLIYQHWKMNPLCPLLSVKRGPDKITHTHPHAHTYTLHSLFLSLLLSLPFSFSLPLSLSLFFVRNFSLSLSLSHFDNVRTWSHNNRDIIPLSGAKKRGLVKTIRPILQDPLIPQSSKRLG